MNKLIIAFFVFKYNLYNILFNFITENFIEVIKIFIDFMAASATVLAFLYTFKNIRDNANKEKNDEIKKNKKTLQMIDLITKKDIDYLEEIEVKIKRIKKGYQIDIRLNDSTNKIVMPEGYQIDFSNIENDTFGFYKGQFSTYKLNIFNLLESYRIIKETNLLELAENYRKNLSEILSNQHLNLSLNSLEKITTKLNTIDKIKSHIKSIENNIDIVQLYAMTETEHPLVRTTQSKNQQKEEYENIIEPKINQKLKEIDHLIKTLENSQKKLSN